MTTAGGCSPGAVIVTTPQDVALADARRGTEMFRQVNTTVSHVSM